MSADAALKYAKSKVGVHEVPANSNKGPQITDWQVKSGYPWVAGAKEGVAWCQCFANSAGAAGGAPWIKNGYTVDFLRGAYKASGFHPISLSDADAGDFVYFRWPGSHDICDHVGILVSFTATTVTCVEGNTSGTDAGSQNNGGGVYLRTRSRSLVAGAVAVPYPDKPAYRNLLLGMRGSDVSAFQEAINKRAQGCGRGGVEDRGVDVDGVYGSTTKTNGAWAAYILGVGDSTNDIKAGGISADVQRWVRDPDSRNDIQKERAGERRKLYCR